MKPKIILFRGAGKKATYESEPKFTRWKKMFSEKNGFCIHDRIFFEGGK